MVTLDYFIERLAFNSRITDTQLMCFDNPKNLPEMNEEAFWEFDSDDHYIDHRAVIKRKMYVMVHGTAMGYGDVCIYVDSDNNVPVAHFSRCSENFLKICDTLGMVNGLPFKHRVHSNNVNGWCFYF